jgi:thiol-disulfide isomerase/thioredoxin
LLGAILLWLLPARPATADEPAEARQLWDAVVKTYGALPAYADHGVWSLATTVGSKALEQSMPMAVRFARPNRFSIEAGPVRVVSDGTRLTTAIEPLKRYVVSPAPAKLSLDAFDNNSLGAILLSGPAGLPLRTVLKLLGASDRDDDILARAKSLVAEADQKQAGQAVAVLRASFSDGPDLRIFVDRETKLVKRIELLTKSSEGLHLPGAPEEGRLVIAWSAGAITTEPPAQDGFAFEAPPGFVRVAELESRKRAQGESKSPLEELVGKPAPEFTLTVLDGPGKTREINKGDLAGKVVVIDFWATWCPPCMAELPEIQKLVDDYAKRNAKDVVVIALSIDADPGAHDDVRTLVEKTLSDKELKLSSGPVSLVGLDPSQTVPKLFHVSGIPTLVILDAKGTIQAVQVGFEAEVRETLSQQIDKLLEGGSLLPKREAAAGEKDQ